MDHKELRELCKSPVTFTFVKFATFIEAIPALLDEIEEMDTHLDRMSGELVDLEGEHAYKQCPFCRENEFDLLGLKIHLNNHCEKYMELK